MINLFSPYYECGEPERQKELDFVRDKNEANPLLKVYYFEGRPCYRDFFTATRDYPNDINILANADIYFDETIEKANDIGLRECYALTQARS